MEDNPYQKLIEAFWAPADAAAPCFGKVAGTAPFKVLVGGTIMERSELLCNAALLPVEPPGWSVGDKLLLIPIEDCQRYVIICKVVGI